METYNLSKQNEFHLQEQLEDSLKRLKRHYPRVVNDVLISKVIPGSRDVKKMYAENALYFVEDNKKIVFSDQELEYIQGCLNIIVAEDKHYKEGEVRLNSLYRLARLLRKHNIREEVGQVIIDMGFDYLGGLEP